MVKAGFESVYVIEKAQMPILKCIKEGVDLDIQFAYLPVFDDLAKFSRINEANLDERSFRSLISVNTVRLINNASRNIQNYKPLVRLIKLWAKKHGVYAAVHGYLGGISWSVMALMIC